MTIARKKNAAKLLGSLVWIGLCFFAFLSESGAVKAALAAPGAVSGSPTIHLSRAQEKSLNIRTVLLKTRAIHPTLRLYGELRKNPNGIWTVSSPLAGVVLTIPGARWPQIGDQIVRGTIVARIRPVVSTTLQITLFLELTKVKADMAAARVAETATAAAYRREKLLYAQNKAVSLQRVQMAQAAFASAHGRVQADAQSILAISRQLKTKAGGYLPLPVLQGGTVTKILTHPGQAVAADQPLLKIENFQTLLAAVALPASESGAVELTEPIQIQVLGHRHWIKATPLAIGSRADRQTRGVAVLYLVTGSPALRPGMAITALVPQTAGGGQSKQWTIIPRSAVVWWHGDRWIYTAQGHGVYALHELIHPKDVPEGYAVKRSSMSVRRVVSQGAQLLMTINLASTLKKAG